MTAEVIPLRARDRPDGNGAREALIALAAAGGVALSEAERWADVILLELGMFGFKVVPL